MRDPDLGLHVDAVLGREDDDTAVPPPAVRDDEFAYDRENLLRPAEHQGVTRFEHLAAPLAQLRHTPVDSAGHQPDQRATDQDAEDDDEEGLQPQGPADIVLHGSRFQRAHEVLPDGLQDPGVDRFMDRHVGHRHEDPGD